VEVGSIVLLADGRSGTDSICCDERLGLGDEPDDKAVDVIVELSGSLSMDDDVESKVGVFVETGFGMVPGLKNMAEVGGALTVIGRLDVAGGKEVTAGGAVEGKMSGDEAASFEANGLGEIKGD
jgi:hypothetical protein